MLKTFFGTGRIQYWEPYRNVSINYENVSFTEGKQWKLINFHEIVFSPKFTLDKLISFSTSPGIFLRLVPSLFFFVHSPTLTEYIWESPEKFQSVPSVTENAALTTLPWSVRQKSKNVLFKVLNWWKSRKLWGKE